MIKTISFAAIFGLTATAILAQGYVAPPVSVGAGAATAGTTLVVPAIAMLSVVAAIASENDNNGRVDIIESKDDMPQTNPENGTGTTPSKATEPSRARTMARTPDTDTKTPVIAPKVDTEAKDNTGLVPDIEGIPDFVTMIMDAATTKGANTTK